METPDLGERFEVERQLGAGGFGTTWAALDKRSGKRVAVKVLDLRRVEDWKSVELFEREAKVLRSLDHPGIPAYVDFRPLEADRAAYLVQALAPGTNLLELLARQRFTEGELVDLMRRVLTILDYLTRLHPVVVHRDIKPANIVLADDGTVSLVDFGAVQDVASATMSGGSTVAGTFGYMAPEQLQGVATPASDLYGLGMTLVHLATGTNPAELDKKRLKPDFRSKVHLSEGLEALIDRMVEPVPDDRPQTAAQVLRALDGLRQPPDDEALSAARIAVQRRAAESEAKTEAERERESRSPAVTQATARFHRVSVTERKDGTELAIRPSQYWRSREAHLGVIASLGLIVALTVGSVVGFAMGTSVVGGFVFLAGVVWWTAPTWRLRVTTAGDFIFYARRPTSPKWVGRIEQLALEVARTSTGEPVAWVYVERPEGRQGHVVFPLTSADASKLRGLQRHIQRGKRR